MIIGSQKHPTSLEFGELFRMLTLSVRVDVHRSEADYHDIRAVVWAASPRAACRIVPAASPPPLSNGLVREGKPAFKVKPREAYPSRLH